MQLKGMTWNHPRGYDPLVAANEAAKREGLGVEVAWDRRSLQDFEHFPLEELARRYDLIVMDHPHVGDAIASGAILPVETLYDRAVLDGLQADVLPVVWNSYVANGQTWALPIDAATQVTVWRSGVLERALESWSDLLDLARDGRVIMPLRSPHALMSLFSLMANAGHPFPENGEVDWTVLSESLALLSELAAHLPEASFVMDPIAVHERLAEGGEAVCAPLTYGYSYYGLADVRRHRLRFAEMPGPYGHGGTTLGGTGLSVSRLGRDPQAAARMALRIASGPWQAAVIAPAGGQPSSLRAQRDAQLDARVNGFWRDTTLTLASAAIRPRHAGYVHFQEQGSEIVAANLRGDVGVRETAEALISAYRASLKRAVANA